jgi:N-acetylglucosaminyl-diphospho-decaprenol L-rhamnosyltransferase
VILNGENLGFAAGNNRGAGAARGDWLVFLNNDTRAEPEWLDRLHTAAVAHPDFALFTSRIVFLHDPSVVDSAGDGYLRAGGAFKRGHGAEATAFTTPREVFGACGGAFMIRRRTFEMLGGFDPRFFMIHQDVDLSYRARLQGFRCWYVADAVVRHIGSGSLGVSSPSAVFYGQRNLEWAWVKNTPGELLLSSAVSHVAYSVAGLVHYARVGRARAALKGKWAALRELRPVLRDRAHPGLAYRQRRRPGAPHGAALASDEAPREGLHAVAFIFRLKRPSSAHRGKTATAPIGQLTMQSAIATFAIALLPDANVTGRIPSP